MWSRMNYSFVLAFFFFETVVSVPHPPTYLENEKPSNPSEENERRFYQNGNIPAKLITAYESINTYESSPGQQSSQDINLLHSLPAYMSPIPTKRQINEAEEDIYPRQKIITNNFRTPRAVLIDAPSTSIMNERQGANNQINSTQQLTVRPVGNQISNQNRIFVKPDVKQIQTSLPEQKVNILPNIVQPVTVEEILNLQNVPKQFFTTSFQGVHHPVDVVGRPANAEDNKPTQTQIPNHGKHVYIPTANAQIAVPEKHYVQNILSSERIRDVLLSTKHTKRYLVIHPNGRVEHVDSMEPIAKSHPNYLLVNAGHIVPSTPKLQVPPVADSVAGDKSPPVIILTDQPVTQVSSVHEVSAEFKAKTETVPVAKEVIVLEEVTSPAENIRITKVTPSVEITPKEENSATTIESLNSSCANAGVTNTRGAIEETVSEQKTAHTPKEENSATTIVINSSLANAGETNTRGAIEETVTEQKTAHTPKEENSATTIESSNSSFANAGVTNTRGAIEETVSEQKTAHAVSETNASSSQDTITEQNDQVIQENFLLKDIGKLEIIDMDSSGKPVAWFSTSDPNFLNKLTKGQDNKIIYFFNVSSRPRIEKDSTRTILPDGTILEEITESVWYSEDDPAPVVTKTFRIIHPDE